MVVKYAGAAYLIWLGVTHHPHARAARDASRRVRTQVPIWRHPFTQGLVNQLANPKSILFWGALFPQFVDFRADNRSSSVRDPRRHRHRRRHHRAVELWAVAARGGRFLAAGRRGLARADLRRGAGRGRRRAVAGQVA